ncbi:hypothetical protein ACHFJ0_12340 [Paracoccus sp. NGMCC 1.201697]|uniref:Uncharacterized protein n=1 Tax=Paracoccus broussonetiae subsp. drimophilus TaxID=3373869 RepID=A0ABW7LQ85_9RHOB
MAGIARLAVEEQSTIDRQRLNQMVEALGEASAARIISAALEQLRLALNRTEAAIARGDLVAVACDADRISRLAWQLGLVSMAAVAIDVGTCAERRDAGGLAATSARLRRIGDSSLTRICDRPDPDAG